MKIDTAMILAAGLGTRLRPVTENIPKALVRVNGKPLLESVIEKLIESGIKYIVINTHHFAEQISDFIKSRGFKADIMLTFEEKILGTGGGIKNAAKYLKSCPDFIVHNVDVISGINIGVLTDFYFSNSGFAALAVQNRKTSRPLLFDETYRLCGRIVDGNVNIFRSGTGTLKQFAFNGIHVLSGKIFEYFPHDDTFDIIPLYLELCTSNKNIIAYDMKDTEWNDYGKYQPDVFDN